MNTTSAIKDNNTYDTEVPGGCIVLNVTAKFIPWDNPHNLINVQVPNTWHRIIYGIFIPVFFLINLPCNALNIIIFFKNDIKERINLCLFFLSLVDFIYIASAFCVHADRIYREVTHQPIRGPLIQFMMNNHLIGLYAFGWVSSWITTIIVCERCFCVLRPLRSQTVLKTKTMWFIILLPSIAIIGVYFVINSKWNIVCVFDPVGNFTYLAIYPSAFFLRNKNVIDTLDAAIYGLLFPQFCVITVTVATIITVIKLRSMSEWRQKSSWVANSMSSRDLSLTRMLVGTSVLYIVCFVPRSAMRISTFFIQDLSMGGRFINMYRFLSMTAAFFAFINSTFNFFIYYAFGTKFRTTLKTLFNKKTKKAAGSKLDRSSSLCDADFK